MATQSYEHTARQYMRAKARAQGALDAPANAQFGLKAMAPKMIARADEFAASEAAVEVAQHACDAARAEADVTLSPLGVIYEECRVIAASEGGAVRPAVGTFNAPEDLLRAATGLETELKIPANQAWAAPLLAEYSPALAAGVQKQKAANDAKMSLQMATQTREQLASASRTLFVHFRKLVRSTFGARSHQLHELRDRRYGSQASEEETPDAPDAGGTPKGPIG